MTTTGTRTTRTTTRTSPEVAERLALFADRGDAGRRLARLLRPLAAERPIVLALPRGGVPVGFEVARALDAPLDVVLVRKLGAPQNPEYGIGAIAEGGARFVRRADAEAIGIGEAELERLIARETAELERRRRLYRGDADPLPVEGRTAILVDDGIATGSTAVVAARALRARGAGRVVLAVPVAPLDTEARLGAEFDAIVCLEQPAAFFGIGQFYADFGQVEDEEVIRLLSRARDPDPQLAADLRVPEPAAGLVLFAHGSGSGRLSPRNRQVAEALSEAGFATLLFDLLTPDEAGDRARVFDIDLLAERLLAATRWARSREDVGALPLAYFGASTGAAAALRAAAELGPEVCAVISRGGRPDLAAESLAAVIAPTLLIVGGADRQVLELNEAAARSLRCPHEVAIVPGATHLFEEPGALERVGELAAAWLLRHCRAPR